MQLKYWLAVCVAAVSASILQQAGAADWLQFGYDSAHSSNNPDESVISAANVATLQPLYSVPISGTDGPPVLLANVEIGAASRDLLFVTTVYGVTAIDAADGSAVWVQSQTSYE